MVTQSTLRRTGQDALWLAGEAPYDVIVLDINIPSPDGVEVCAQLRAQQNWTPILLLTGRGDVSDRVRGLDAGADDYLVKPFAVAELRARLRALVRRGAPARPALLCAGDVVVDPAAQRVLRDGQEVCLTAREYTLLEMLVRQCRHRRHPRRHRRQALGFRRGSRVQRRRRHRAATAREDRPPVRRGIDRDGPRNRLYVPFAMLMNPLELVGRLPGRRSLHR